MAQPLSLSAVPHIAELLFCLVTQYGHRSYGNGEALLEERDRLSLSMTRRHGGRVRCEIISETRFNVAHVALFSHSAN